VTGEYEAWRGITFQPARETILPDALLPYLRAHSHVLDVGCNKGAVALFLGQAGHRVHGIDLNPDAIDIAVRRAREVDLSGALQFEVADLLEMDGEAQFDAVTMIRFLTCLPDEADWRQANSKARAMLADDGLLYIQDFLLTWGSDDYRRRYEEGAALGWRFGNFAVRKPDGALQFIAHHHSAEELAELRADYRTEIFRPYSSISIHGNEVLMFELLLRKLPSST